MRHFVSFGLALGSCEASIFKVANDQSPDISKMVGAEQGSEPDLRGKTFEPESNHTDTPAKPEFKVVPRGASDQKGEQATAAADATGGSRP